MIQVNNHERHTRMTTRTYAYEAMFLISQATAADLAGAVSHINGLLARAKADVLAMRKWDERRLAYEIQGQKRGVFILTYFKAPANAIAGLERDCNLSEQIMRAMILRADHLSEDEMRAADARQQLEDEARLRASAPAAAPAMVAAGLPEEDEPALDDSDDDLD